MKRLLFLLSFISLHFVLDAQPMNGLGTWASPYNGVFEADKQWNFTNFPGGKVYINGDVTIDNELLTIEAGMSIIFISESADLIINGTGRIVASGSVGNLITFTSDDDNDGIYGETTERWGHIAFINPSAANQSKLEYCIIEFGDVRSGSNTSSYGGAVYVEIYNNLLIDNCIIRFNKATHGGAIMLLSGASPAISNCLITGNAANTSGGAIYSQAMHALILSNCIVSFNSAGSGGGGGIFLDGSDLSRFLNCSIVKNSTTATDRGQNIHFYAVKGTAIRPRFINCIIWDSDNSIDYSATSTILLSDFVNCAIRDIATPASSFTTCIDLNTVNTAATGPNFIATDGSDWSIKFISPCRDGGVDTYPRITIPISDYIGNPKIGIKDIGAYEVQYSWWKTTASSTDWGTAGNWDGGVPANTMDVVVPAGASNYPTGSPAQDFTIGSGKQMIIEHDARVTLNNLTNNGILKLNSTSAGLASLIINNYTRGAGGSEEIQLYLTGGGTAFQQDYKWHYISSPVTSLSTNTFTGVTFDLAQFIESRPALSLMQGWVAYDGYEYSSGTMTGITFNTLTSGKGYNFWDGINNTFTFGGLLNTSNVAMSLPYGGVPSRHGFNLLGNPFSSGLNWDDIVNSVYFPYPSNTSKGLYFTRNNTQCTYIGGVGTPGDVTGIIPPMQGFFTKTYSIGNTITLPAAARTNTGIHSTYKGSSGIPLVRLQLSKDTINYDETVVRFDDYAKPELDYDFDAMKMFLSSSKNQIYSSLAGTNFAINGVPFPAPETLFEVPIVINTTATGSYKISCIQLQALDGFDVVLEDKVTGTSRNLKIISLVTFSSEAGTIADRFILKVGDNILTGIDDIDNRVNNFNIYSSDNFINVVPQDDEWSDKIGSVTVFDLTGRPAGRIDNVGFHKDVICQIGAPGAKGMYVVEIRAGVKKYVGKVVIR